MKFNQKKILLFIVICITLTLIIGCDKNSIKIFSSNNFEMNKELKSFLRQIEVNDETENLKYFLADEFTNYQSVISKIISKTVAINSIEIVSIEEVDNLQLYKLIFIGKIRNLDIEISLNEDKKIVELLEITPKMKEELIKIKSGLVTEEVVIKGKKIVQLMISKKNETIYSMLPNSIKNYDEKEITDLKSFNEYIDLSESELYLENRELKYVVDKSSEFINLKISHDNNIMIEIDFDKDIEIKNIQFPLVNKLYANKLKLNAKNYKLEEVYLDMRIMHINPEFIDRNEEEFFDSVSNTHRFFELLNKKSYTLLYSFMADEFCEKLTLEELVIYIDLMKKRIGINEVVSKGYVFPKISVNYSNIFYEPSYVQENVSRNIFYNTNIEMNEFPKNLNDIGVSSVIENVYLTKSKPYILETIPDNKKLREKNLEILINALINKDYELLYDIDAKHNHLNKDEFIEFIKLQEKIISTFSGVYYLSNTAKIFNNNGYVVECLIREENSLNRLIVEFNNEQEIISFNVASMFTLGGGHGTMD